MTDLRIRTVKNSSHTNRLIDATSPYLLQHAHNPVEWYPWGPQALEKARRETKPILLSIGYSACHWCHVMAHESFEDEVTAKIMNEYFVNIKVDREERPDLDRIYQTAYQLLHGRGGGWPLNMVLTPDDHVPFFGGTYFPKEPRYGMPAFADLLHRLVDYYRTHGEEIRGQNAALLLALETNAAGHAKSETTPDPKLLNLARDQLLQSFDTINGGFGDAPKFPYPTSIERLLRHWAYSLRIGVPDRDAENAAFFTLRKMANGGIYDHLGGGFSRYSVDQRWMIPHFEKMLYDNGPLLALYSEAWRASGDSLFEQVAAETANWVINEMQSPEGGYFSTLDADSEGDEGKYYIWTREEVESVLTRAEFAVAAPRFGLDSGSNFEGRWHLHVVDGIQQIAERIGVDPGKVEASLATAKQKLYTARELRVRPSRDEKILTSWNGLMIRGMAIAGRHLEQRNFVESAERALDFVHDRLWRDGRLLTNYKDGRAHCPAYLNDYAFLIDAILELLQVRWRNGDLDLALRLTDTLLDHFEDVEHGGFFFTADDHETLIQRPKPVHDDALPSGNGIAAQVLLRLGHLLGETRYLDAAERCIKWAWPSMQQAPIACNALLLALEEYVRPGQTIILRGDIDAIKPWQRRCTDSYAPQRFTLAIPNGAKNLPAALETDSANPGPVAQVCYSTHCLAPIVDRASLETELVNSANSN